VSPINLGKELKILAPRKAKALCPVASLHLGNVSLLFCSLRILMLKTGEQNIQTEHQAEKLQK